MGRQGLLAFLAFSCSCAALARVSLARCASAVDRCCFPFHAALRFRACAGFLHASFRRHAGFDATSFALSTVSALFRLSTDPSGAEHA